MIARRTAFRAPAAALAVLVVSLGVGAPALAHEDEPHGPPSGEPASATQLVGPGDVGPGEPEYDVGRTTIQITSEPGRTLDADVWYPADAAAAASVPPSVYRFPGLAYTSAVAHDSPPVAPGGPFPLIVYSHGSGGLRYVSAFLTEALAARGFVVVAVDHTGNTALDAFTETTLPRAEIRRLRPIDIRAEIDAMLAASADPASPFAGAVDPSRIGLVGHSAGALGALDAVARDGTAADADVRAIVGLGAYTEPLTRQQLASIDVPTMLVSGTFDTTTPTRRNAASAARQLGSHPLYMVDLTDAGHQSFSDICFYEDVVAATPDVAPAIATTVAEYGDEACTDEHLPIEQAHRLIDRYAIGFLERYVAGVEDAERWLEPTQPKVVDVQVQR